MARTTREIIERYRAQHESDFFGFGGEVLLSYLSEDELRPFLKAGAELKDWKPVPLDRESVLAEMRHYMSFAWDKALGHRGISASRSVDKMREWCWVLGDDEAVAFIDTEGHYRNYGAPVLLHVSEKYGFPVPDDPAARRMAQGMACRDGCEEGCDRGIG